MRTYNACATGDGLGCLIEMDREEILISHTTKSHVELQGGESKRNPEMEETALQRLSACQNSRSIHFRVTFHFPTLYIELGSEEMLVMSLLTNNSPHNRVPVSRKGSQAPTYHYTHMGIAVNFKI